MSDIKKTHLAIRHGYHIRDVTTLDHLNKLSHFPVFFKSAGEYIAFYCFCFLRLERFSSISTARPWTERFQIIHSAQIPELRKDISTSS